ncbi:MAG: DUF1552 domain-containing protein [Pirellulaceae bacterium]
MFFPNGTNPEHWEPETVRCRLGDEEDSLEPLRELRTNSQSSAAAPVNALLWVTVPATMRNAAAFLTGAHPPKTSGANMRVGTSADQVAAEHYGRSTRLASIELGTESGRAALGLATAVMPALLQQRLVEDSHAAWPRKSIHVWPSIACSATRPPEPIQKDQPTDQRPTPATLDLGPRRRRRGGSIADSATKTG